MACAMAVGKKVSNLRRKPKFLRLHAPNCACLKRVCATGCPAKHPACEIVNVQKKKKRNRVHLLAFMLRSVPLSQFKLRTTACVVFAIGSALAKSNRAQT